MQTIQITLNDDGSVAVATVAQPDPQAAAGAQQFASIDEALAAVPALLSGEAAPEAGMDPAAAPSNEDAFKAGFKSVRGTPDEQDAAGMVG